MKKLILASASIVALSTAVPAFAQAVAPTPATPVAPTVPSPECDGATANCSVITQSGDTLTTDVEQTGSASVSSISQDGDGLDADVSQGAGANISNVTQTASGANATGLVATVTQADGAGSVINQDAAGDDSNGFTAVVNQIGASNSEINQTSASNNGTSGMLATVNQTGDGNASVVSQVDQGGGGQDGNHTATVTQSGTGNQSELTQINSRQDATVLQLGDNGISVVTQQGGNTSTAFVRQEVGTANNASAINQRNRGNDADVRQTGSDNISDVNQVGRANTATVRQRGDFGNATINQDGNARAETAAIVQESFATAGAEDIAIINQTGTAAGGTAANNDARIVQRNGNTNTSIILQGDTTDDTLPGGDSVNNVQTGAFNADADNIQDGANMESLIVQGEFDQVAFVRQIGDGMFSIVQQGAIAGSGNDANVVQDGVGTNPGVDGFSVVFQDSDGNQAIVRQLTGENASTVDQGFVGGTGFGGDSNIANVRQEGDGNDSVVRQSDLLAGTGNDALLRQIGDDNTSTILQNGMTNMADVRQFDGSTSTVDQTGMTNMATVRQGTP